MDNQNVVAARLGLPFKCGVCSEVHERADLNDKDVCRCFVKMCEHVLGHQALWFDSNGDQIIRKPTWELRESESFNMPRIYHSYPFENDVFMLAMPMGEITKNLRKKVEDWKYDCLIQAIQHIEEKGELNKVEISSGILVINGYKHLNVTYPIYLVMMKRQEIASALARIWYIHNLDIEWKSLKQSAKLLVAHYISGNQFTLFASESTGIANVPNKICSVLEADDFLRRLSPREKNIDTLQALFGMADILIRQSIPSVLTKYGLNEYAKRLRILPPLDSLTMKDAKVLLEEVLKSTVVNDKFSSIYDLEASVSTLNALEKAYKNILDDTGDDTIQNDFSIAIHWIAKIEQDVIFRCSIPC
jgi:hypothetical protein